MEPRKELSVDDPSYVMHSFIAILKETKNQFLTELLDLEKESELSFLFDLSQCQSSTSFRIQRRSLKLATFLIDDSGEWNEEKLAALVTHLEKKGYVYYPQGSNDAVFFEHVLRCLHRFHKEDILRKEIKKFQNPLCHKWAETIIRFVMGVREERVLSTADIRRTVLSSCFSLLRQNVGSCFATAPAILIQKEQLENLLSDLYDLLMTGKLKRVIRGQEFTVPLSPNMGHGDLQKNVQILNRNGTLWMSPGLMAAMEAAEILPPDINLPDKILELSKLFTPICEVTPDLTLEEAIRCVLLHHFGLTEVDLRNFRSYEMQLAKRSKQDSVFIYESVPSKLKDKCNKFIRAHEWALSTFKAQTDHLLLKTWEYTIASFSEVKMEFSKWNMYSSLGLHPEEKGGIGALIAQFLDQKIKESNQKLEEYHKDYELAFDHMRATEALLKRASSEEEGRRLQIEFQSRLHHMQACLDLRDRFYKKASRYSSMLSFLLEQFDKVFPEYFQEIYDAAMQDVKVGLYEDSPAGFRLVYKHGRANASLWTMIYSAEEYLDALADFFHMVEPIIIAECDWEGAEEDIKDILSAVILHIRREEFLTSALTRMAKIHNAPVKKDILKSLEKVEKKPWAYTSGGSMHTLLKSYYRREGEIAEEARWIENEMDLLVFLLDTMKALPFFVTQSYVKHKHKALLMHSPTHAFLLHPGFETFREGWEENRFSYTWVRDHFVLPSKNYFSSLYLDEEEQKFLIKIFSKTYFPMLEHALETAFASESRTTISEFRFALIQGLQRVMGFASLNVGSLEDMIDSFLYESIPLTPSREWKEKVSQILKPKVSSSFAAFLEMFEDPSDSFLTLKGLKNIAKSSFIQFKKDVVTNFDLHSFVAERTRSINMAPISTILFGDTNWPHYYFAFVINPATENMELWRMNYTGEEGIRMRDWSEWLNGLSRQTWGVFTQPGQYSILPSFHLKNNLKKL